MIQDKFNKRLTFDRQCLPKKMKIFFILLQVLFSLDFGFIDYKSPKIKLWSKLCILLLHLCLGIIILVILYTRMDNYYQMWGVKTLLECYLHIAILFFSSEDKTFCFYQMELYHFDKQIGVKSSSYKIDTKILLFWFSSSLFDIVWMFVCYIFRVDDYMTVIFLRALFYIPNCTYNLPLIVLFFVYYSIFCRLEKLKIYIKKRKSSVWRAHQLYRFLIDSIDNILKSYKYIFLVNLMFNIPGMMASLYTLIKAIREKDDINISIVAPYVDLIHILAVKFVPTVAASWLSQEALNVKLILENRLLEENDGNQARAMQRFIRYTEVRPFKFYMLSMIPMDVSLLVIVLDFCISYLVVIIQLTHIY